MSAKSKNPMSNSSTYRITAEALKARKALQKTTGLTAAMVISEALMEKFTKTFVKPIIELTLLDPAEYASLIEDISTLVHLHKENLKKWRKVGTADKDLLAKIKFQTDFTTTEIKKLQDLRLRIGRMAQLQSSLSPDDLVTLDALKAANNKVSQARNNLQKMLNSALEQVEHLKSQLSMVEEEHSTFKRHSKEQIASLRQERDTATAKSQSTQEGNITAKKVASIINGLTETEIRQLQWAAEGFKKQINEAKSRNSSDAAPFEITLKIINPLLP